MPPIIILECNRCSGLLLAALDQKTRTCPYCGGRVYLDKAKCIASAQNAFEASEVLRKIKAKRQSNSRKMKPK